MLEAKNSNSNLKWMLNIKKVVFASNGFFFIIIIVRKKNVCASSYSGQGIDFIKITVKNLSASS